MIDGKQMTVVWHADDLKVSHKSSKVVDKFIEWLEKKCGDPKINEIEAVRGKKHDHLAMMLDYSSKGEAKIEELKLSFSPGLSSFFNC